MRTKTAIAGGLLAVMLSGASLAADWPNSRGPDHNGISTEKGWLTAWPKAGPKRLWTTEVGPGHAGVAVRAGKVYIMGRHGDRDVVSCFNADTGATVWKQSYAAAESSYGRGPRATPAVDGKAVYTVRRGRPGVLPRRGFRTGNLAKEPPEGPRPSHAGPELRHGPHPRWRLTAAEYGSVGTGPGQEHRQGYLEERGRFELLVAGAFQLGRETLRGPVCCQ